MAVLRVHFSTIEGLVAFWNDLAHMLYTLRRCAESIFDQGPFKVKVIV